MPDPIRQLLSQTTYVADGTTTEWNFSFSGGYLKNEHVKAFYTLNGSKVDVTLSLPGQYVASITPAVPASAILTIYRDTPKATPLVTFTDKTYLAQTSLDYQAKQAIFGIAEVDDFKTTATLDAAAAGASAGTAAATTIVGLLLAGYTKLADLASSTGAALVKYRGITGAALTSLFDHASWNFSLKKEGAKGDGVTDDTAKAQAAMTYAMYNFGQGPVYVEPGRYVVHNLSLGDPLTKDDRFPNEQANGIYALRGAGRLQSVFIPRQATTGAVISRHNLAGVEIRDIGVDGLGIADYGIDVRWDIVNAGAPSCQNIGKSWNVSNCRKVGIMADNYYDSTADSWRSNGSPVAVCMRGGGGSLRATNWNMGGAAKVSAQDFTFNNCELLGGLIIDGNTRNSIYWLGGQGFGLGLGGPGVGSSYADDGYINPNSYGWVIDAQNSGTYGCNLAVTNADLFGGKGLNGALVSAGILKGKLGGGATFTKCYFQWDPTSPFAVITAGYSTRPVIEFLKCTFANANSPFDNVPSDYDVVMVDCILHDGRRVNLDTRKRRYPYTPRLESTGSGSFGLVTGASTRATRLEDVVKMFFDFTVGSNAGVTGIPVINGLPWMTDPSGFGSQSFSYITGLSLSGGYTDLTMVPTPNSYQVAFFKKGPGLGSTPCSVSDLPAGLRLAGSFEYHTNDI